MALLRGLTLCRFAESRGWGWGWGTGGWHHMGTERGRGGHEHPHHHRPAPAPVSAPAGKRWACPTWHLRLGWGQSGHELPQFPPAPSPKGLRERDVAVIPMHHHFSQGGGAGSRRPGCLHPTLHLGEGDGVGGQGWGVRGPGPRCPPMGNSWWVPACSSCEHSWPRGACELGQGGSRARPREDGGPKWLLEHGAGLAVLELTGPGRDLVI